MSPRKPYKEVKISPIVYDFLKIEVARELGYDNIDLMDKGNLPSGLLGTIGSIVRKRVRILVKLGCTNEEMIELIKKYW